MDDAAQKLLKEQADFFKRGGVSVEEAREMGVGFLYEDVKGTVQQEPQERPEDAVPDLPENQKVRAFLKKAPSKGLWMPLGTEVKAMQCWRCKSYGHRTGDRECPMANSGNLILDAQRQAREDPMSTYVGKKHVHSQEKEMRRKQLEAILDDIRKERKEKKKRKKKDKKKKRKKKKEQMKQKKSKKKDRDDSSSDSSDSSSSSSSSSSSEDEGDEKGKNKRSSPSPLSSSSKDEDKRKKHKHDHKNSAKKA